METPPLQGVYESVVVRCVREKERQAGVRVSRYARSRGQQRADEVKGPWIGGDLDQTEGRTRESQGIKQETRTKARPAGGARMDESWEPPPGE